MKLDWRADAPQIVLILLMFLASILVWPLVSDQVPVHWNIAGEVDRYGGKLEGLFLTPIIALVVYVLLLVLPRFDPARANYARFAGAYAVLRLVILGFLAAVQAMLLFAATGQPSPIDTLLPILLGLLFVVIGATMGRVEPNSFVGVRTPWTLNSRDAWVKTHRWSMWVFGVSGVAFLVGGLLGAVWALILAFSIMLLGIVALVIYSYVVWRHDPNKGPLFGTT